MDTEELKQRVENLEMALLGLEVLIAHTLPQEEQEATNRLMVDFFDSLKSINANMPVINFNKNPVDIVD